MMANWNVLEAAEVHGIGRICMASSVNAVGAGWGSKLYTPEYYPVDEKHPTRAEDAYSQSKWLGEEMGEAFVRRRPGKSPDRQHEVPCALGSRNSQTPPEIGR